MPRLVVGSEESLGPTRDSEEDVGVSSLERDDRQGQESLLSIQRGGQVGLTCCIGAGLPATAENVTRF